MYLFGAGTKLAFLLCNEKAYSLEGDQKLAVGFWMIGFIFLIASSKRLMSNSKLPLDTPRFFKSVLFVDY